MATPDFLSLKQSKSSDIVVDRPSQIKILQKDFLEYLMLELRVSKPPALERLRRMSLQGLVFIDATEARKTTVCLDLPRFAEKWLNGENEAERFRGKERRKHLEDGRPLGEWPLMRDLIQRMRATEILEQDPDPGGDNSLELDGCFSQVFLEKYRSSKSELRKKHSPGESHIGALCAIFGQMLGKLTIKELVSLLGVSKLLHPFDSVEWSGSKSASVRPSDIWGYSEAEYSANLKRLFNDIGEPYSEPPGGFARMAAYLDDRLPGWDKSLEDSQTK